MLLPHNVKTICIWFKCSETKPCVNLKQLNFKVTFAHSSDSNALLTTRLGANLFFSFASAAPTSPLMSRARIPLNHTSPLRLRSTAECRGRYFKSPSRVHATRIRESQSNISGLQFRKQVSQVGWAAVVVTAAQKKTGRVPYLCFHPHLSCERERRDKRSSFNTMPIYTLPLRGVLEPNN